MIYHSYSEPFDHIIVPNYLDAVQIERINREWPLDGWLKEDGRFQRKWSLSNVPKSAREVVDGLDVARVSEATGIVGLFLDPCLVGGGLHSLPSGGFLNMHTDFNVHPDHGWHRRVNVLVFLNRDWDYRWGGGLVLGAHREKTIAPMGGTAVIFPTTKDSWHGNPDPVKCPVDRDRRSLAMYLYTAEPPKKAEAKTVYKR